MTLKLTRAMQLLRDSLYCSMLLFVSSIHYSDFSAERESKSKSPRPLTNGMKEAKKTEENGTTDKTEDKAEEDPDSYEARREARRKAREERLKAASAKSVPLRYSVVLYRDDKQALITII